MVLYPIAYVVLSLPLPTGRLVVWSGSKVSTTLYCLLATLMTSCGFVDTILYTLTRRVLTREINHESSGLGVSTAEKTATSDTALEKGNRAAMTPGTWASMTQDTDTTDSTEGIRSTVKTESSKVRGYAVHQERV